MKDSTGEELSDLDVVYNYRKRYGAPYIVLHRSDLQNILLEACKEHPNVEIQTNQSIQKVTNRENCVKSVSKKGDVHETAAVIGADGLWSDTRKHFSYDEPICFGHVA